MKKQLLIAAVAATMTSAAMADISITGGAYIKWSGKDSSVATTSTTEAISQGFDIDITGKTGNTTANAHLDVDENGTSGVNVDKVWMTTQIGDVTVKAGDYSSCTGMVEGIAKCSTTDNGIALSTKVGDMTVGISGSADSSVAQSISLSGTVAGMKVAIKDKEDTFTNFAISGDLAVGTGTGFYLEHMNKDAADSDSTLFAAHTKVGDATISIASLDADETGATGNDGDLRVLGSSLVGDYHTAAYSTNTTMTDVKGIAVNTDVAGNNVNIAFINADTNGANDDLDLVDVVVQRKLASGATLDLSYGTADLTSSTDTTNYGAQVTVKF